MITVRFVHISTVVTPLQPIFTEGESINLNLLAEEWQMHDSTYSYVSVADVHVPSPQHGGRVGGGRRATPRYDSRGEALPTALFADL